MIRLKQAGLGIRLSADFNSIAELSAHPNPAWIFFEI